MKVWQYRYQINLLDPTVAKNTRFSIFTDNGIRKTILDIFKISSFVLPFKKCWSFEGPLRLVVQQKKLHIWKWHDNRHQMRYLRSWWDQKWKFWTTNPTNCIWGLLIKVDNFRFDRECLKLVESTILGDFRPAEDFENKTSTALKSELGMSWAKKIAVNPHIFVLLIWNKVML